MSNHDTVKRPTRKTDYSPDGDYYDANEADAIFTTLETRCVELLEALATANETSARLFQRVTELGATIDAQAEELSGRRLALDELEGENKRLREICAERYDKLVEADARIAALEDTRE